MKTAVVVGATSPLAPSVARRFAGAGFRILLVGRSVAALAPLAAEIEETFGVSASVATVDVMVSASLDGFLDRFAEDVPEVVVSLLGRQEDKSRTRDDLAYIQSLMVGNLIAPAILLERFGTLMQARGAGTLIGVSSIVGDRGRAKNYPYGAGKAGFNAFLSGLRQRLWSSGVHVATIKPGVVRVSGRSVQHPDWLTTTPDVVASAIFEAWRRRQNIVYVPTRWRWMMLGVRLIPETLFRRLRF